MTSEEQWEQMRVYAYQYALGLTKGRVQLAEDLAQDAMLSLIRVPTKIDGTVWRAFVQKVVYRRWVDYWRKPYNVREKTTATGEMDRHYVAVVHVPREPYGDDMKAALDALTPEIRECVWSVVVDGYTHQETADRLNIPLGTVLSRVYRGKAHLKHQLEKTHAN